MSNNVSEKTKQPTTEQALKPKLRFPEFRDAGEWEIKLLEDVAPLQRGFDLPSDQIKSGNIPVVYSNGIQSFHNQGMAKGPGLVTGRSGTIGKIHFIEEGDYWPHNTSLWVTSFKGNFPKFIYYLYKSIGMERFASGSGVPTLNRNYVHAFRTRVPSSISEQQKIADCLSSLDELITAEAQKLDTLRAYKKGLMQQLFPSAGETLPKLRFPEFQDVEEWEVRNFYDLLEDVLDFRGRTPLKLGMDWGGGNIVSLSANNVKNGYIDFNAECNLGSEELYEKWMGKVNLEKGDIVFTMEAPLGNALLIPDSKKYILSQRVVAFKTKKNVNNSFLIQLIWGSKFQNEMERLSTGSTAKGINQKTLKKVDVRIPTEENEQQKIADCLSSLDELIAAQKQKLELLREHKKGLMQQLFPALDEVNG